MNRFEGKGWVVVLVVGLLGLVLFVWAFTEPERPVQQIVEPVKAKPRETWDDFQDAPWEKDEPIQAPTVIYQPPAYFPEKTFSERLKERRRERADLLEKRAQSRHRINLEFEASQQTWELENQTRELKQIKSEVLRLREIEQERARKEEWRRVFGE